MAAASFGNRDFTHDCDLFQGKLCDMRFWGESRPAASIPGGMKTSSLGNEQGLATYVPLRDGLDGEDAEAGPIITPNGQQDGDMPLTSYGRGIATPSSIKGRDARDWATPAAWSADYTRIPFPITSGFLPKQGVTPRTCENADGDSITLGKAKPSDPARASPPSAATAPRSASATAWPRAPRSTRRPRAATPSRAGASP